VKACGLVAFVAVAVAPAPGARRQQMRQRACRRCYLAGVRLRVKVNAGAQSESVRRLADGSLQVRTRAPATKGKANKRVVELLAEHLGVAPFDIEIVAGHTSPVKHVEVHGR
jgi:uncharacterized protein (TIGR00251 family)